jgi:hypothetical protein
VPGLVVELLLEHAARVSPVSSAHAAIATDLRLFISGTSPFATIGGRV